MRIKLNTLAQLINTANPSINLPRSSIHDAYCLEYTLTLNNSGSASVTPTMTDVLKAIESIVVTSDSSLVHYSLSGLDLARRNAYASAAGTDQVLFRTLSAIGAGNSATISFVLYLDEGDIVAVAHNNLELKSTFTATAGTLAVANPQCQVTIVEAIPSPEELAAKYGANLEYVEEPKVYAQEIQGIPANTEFTGVFDLPTGTLLRGCMVTLDNEPEMIGILQTTPDRVEIEKVSWETIRAIDERKFRTKGPEGTITLDFGTQWQDNGVGKNGWSFNKGDKQLALKTAATTTLRYVSFERIVNINAYNANVAFTLY
jgi:hypothetical protein